MDPIHFEAIYPPKTRYEEINLILNLIKSGKSLSIIGIPGVGRGNVLGLLSYNKGVKQIHLQDLAKWFHFVHMDFSEVKTRSPFDVLKFMLISIAYSLSERKLTTEYEMVNGFLKEAIVFQDELILFQALKKTIDYLAIEKELTIVLLFDRFEQYVPQVTETFFSNLRILRNRAKYRFSTVFSVNRPLEELVEPLILAEYYEFVADNDIYLPLYDLTGLEFRYEYIEKITGKKLEEKAKKEVVQITGGHGRLAKLAFEIFLSHETKDRNAAELLTHHSVQGALYEIWNSLTPSEQKLLQNVINNVILSPIKSGLSETKDLDSSLARRDQNDNVQQYLHKVGLIQNGKITIPLFEDYIKQKPSEKSEDITYIADKNEIKKGSETLSDKLSPSEFKLLRFLIQNQDRVCEKDEIITAVWKDSKTQVGVTDQALDQIVYRLRKKVEEDPNNPTHIQTVKGRGFKFTP